MVLLLALWFSTTFSTMPIVRGKLFGVSCPRVFEVLDHPVTLNAHVGQCSSKYFCMLALVVLYLCIGVFGGSCTLCLFFAEVGVQFDFTNLISCYLVRTILTSFKVVVQASPLKMYTLRKSVWQSVRVPVFFQSSDFFGGNIFRWRKIWQRGEVLN